MSEITVVARLAARKESVETVKRELLKMVEPTRKEAGCIEYHLCQDNKDPAVFVFYEIWESTAVLEKHKDTDHYKYYAANVLGMIGKPCGAVRDEFETTVLFEMKLEAVIPATHRLVGRKRISLKELEQDKFVGYSEESFPCRNQTIINACQVAGFRPDVHYQADSLVEVLAIVCSGDGVCLMPADVASLSHPGALFIPVGKNWRQSTSRLPGGGMMNGFCSSNC